MALAAMEVACIRVVLVAPVSASGADATFCLQGKCVVFDMTDEEVRGLKIVGPNPPGIPGSGPGSGVAGWIGVIRHFLQTKPYAFLDDSLGNEWVPKP